jgi:protein required for attachment to host cells
MKRDRPAEDCV